MSTETQSADNVVERLSCHDSTLNQICLIGKQHTDAELAELADCLLAHPDATTYISFTQNQLTDQTGAKLARYLAASSTLQLLDLSNNQFGEATYLAVAAALCVNSSLRVILLHVNEAVDRPRVDAAFVEALWLNPERPAQSLWLLYSNENNDFKRLKDAAEELGHPSLQMLLALLC